MAILTGSYYEKTVDNTSILFTQVYTFPCSSEHFHVVQNSDQCLIIKLKLIMCKLYNSNTFTSYMNDANYTRNKISITIYEPKHYIRIHPSNLLRK